MDDPAEAAALARDAELAEQQATAPERTDLRLTRRRGRLRALLDLGPLGEVTLHAWLRGTDRPHPEDTRPLGERRGDALLDLLARAAAGRPHPDDPDSLDAESDDDEPERPGGQDPLAPVSPVALLTVPTTLDALRAGLAGAGRLDTAATLSAATLRQLACDALVALVVPAVLAGPSQVLDLGRSTRVWNRAQRRAVALRDRGCIAPGCDRPPVACHVHHGGHWTDDGPTDLHNPTSR